MNATRRQPLTQAQGSTQPPILLTLATILFSCASGCMPPSTPLADLPADYDAQIDASLMRVGFGSCNKQRLDQSYWPTIAAHEPTVWLWGGDVVYADTQELGPLLEAYDVQQKNPEYAAFASRFPILGIWDDHDYGDNNADRTYSLRAESQQRFLDFLGEPADTPRRRQEGIYASHDYVLDGISLKIILLDVRYHRDTPPGDILGGDQWTWLETLLADSDADIHLVTSGSQVLRDDLEKDTWMQHPESFERLMGLFETHRTPGLVLLSGDLHVAELSLREDVLDYPVYELTSSGLTHTKTTFDLENSYRQFFLGEKNFSMIDITRLDGAVNIHLQVYDADDEMRIYQMVPLDTLQPL